MFIGHLPAGYILSKAFKDKSGQIALLIGSIIPDLDLIYFYTIGQKSIVHHEYWTHMPVFWLVVCLVSWPCLFVVNPRLHKAAPALFLGAILHLALDSITGGVLWFMPFSDWSLTFFSVPSLYKSWQLNFILHWTFALEIITCCCAGYLYIRVHK